MPQDPLNATFAALADPTRRAMLSRLASGEATVNQLAAPFHLTQPSISKPLKVLAPAGLISPGRPRRRSADAAAAFGTGPAAAAGAMGRDLPSPLGRQLRPSRCPSEGGRSHRYERQAQCRQVTTLTLRMRPS